MNAVKTFFHVHSGGIDFEAEDLYEKLDQKVNKFFEEKEKIGITSTSDSVTFMCRLAFITRVIYYEY